VDRARELARRLQLTPAWIRDLTHRRWWRRAEAALALGFTQESSSYDGLIARLDDHHEEVRAAAVEALGRLGDLRAVPELLARLPEQSRHQRARIVDAIGALGHTGAADIVAYARRCPEHLPLLKELLVSVAGTAAAPDLLGWVASDLPATRSAALWALGTIGVDETSFPHARRALSDDADEVRAMAARALGRSRREDAVPLLAASLEDIWVVSAFSAQALSELGTAGLAALRARAWEEGPAGDLARHVLWEKQSAA
jgi:HEAT repeat protein